MAVIHLKGLSPQDAEKAISQVWYVLEQCDIESPSVQTRSDRHGLLDVRFFFATQHNADAVSAALEGVWAVILKGR